MKINFKFYFFLFITILLFFACKEVVLVKKKNLHNTHKEGLTTKQTIEKKLIDLKTIVLLCQGPKSDVKFNSGININYIIPLIHSLLKLIQSKEFEDALKNKEKEGLAISIIGNAKANYKKKITPAINSLKKGIKNFLTQNDFPLIIFTSVLKIADFELKREKNQIFIFDKKTNFQNYKSEEGFIYLNNALLLTHEIINLAKEVILALYHFYFDFNKTSIDQLNNLLNQIPKNESSEFGKWLKNIIGLLIWENNFLNQLKDFKNKSIQDKAKLFFAFASPYKQIFEAVIDFFDTLEISVLDPTNNETFKKAQAQLKAIKIQKEDLNVIYKNEKTKLRDLLNEIGTDLLEILGFGFND